MFNPYVDKPEWPACVDVNDVPPDCRPGRAALQQLQDQIDLDKCEPFDDVLYPERRVARVRGTRRED